MRSHAAGLGLALAILTGAPAGAQDKVYRCGTDGRTYSATPCPEGREVPVADPRSAAQQGEARAAADREAGLAEQLRAERRLRERDGAARGGAAGIVAGRRDKPVAQAKPPKHRQSKKRHAQAPTPGDQPFTARGKPAR